MSRTPTYILTDSVVVAAPGNARDAKTLPQGSFVSPIGLAYVPKHVLDDETNRWFNQDTHVFCFTRLGIVSIAKCYVREA